MSNKTNAKATKAPEPVTAFIHGRAEVRGKGENAKTVTSLKFDKILGNLAKLGIKVAALYTEPAIEAAAFKVVVTPVTQEEYDEALSKIFN